MKRIFLFISLFCILTLFFSCQAKKDICILKLAHGLDVTHPVHKAMEYMAERTAKISKGKMRVDIYPSEQLGSERELIELLQVGSIAMTKTSTAPLEGFVPEMKIFSIPYIFRNAAHFWKVLNGDIGKRLALACEKYYLRGLCYYDAGARSFYTTKKPIRSPKDLKGLKIRVMKSITSVEMIRSLGGSATPIDWGELYTALQQGVVDGAENNPPSFNISMHYEICKYYSLDEHTAVPDILLISTHVWKRLSDQEQEWLQKAIDESVIFQRKLWKKFSDDSLKVVQKAGVTIYYPDKKPFQQSVKKMHDSYKGTPVYKLMQEIKAVQ